MKKSRKGDIEIKYIISGVLAALILFMVVSGYWKRVEFFVFIAKLLPGFEEPVLEGTSIVGYNLKTQNLEYFTGDKWRKIDSSDKGFTLDKYEFTPDKLKSELRDFYFLTPRKPGKLVVEINNWRYWDIIKGNSYEDIVTIFPYTKKTFVENEKIDSKDGYIEIDYFGKVNRVMPEEKERSFPFFTEVESSSEDVLKYIELSVDWMDSILGGNKCEKFLVLSNLKKDKNETNEKTYTLRRVDNYLFIDLSKPVIDGVEQDYDNDKCFGVDNYDDSKFKISDRNSISLPEIRFDFTDTQVTKGRNYLSYDYNSKTLEKRYSGWAWGVYFEPSHFFGNSFYKNILVLFNENGLFARYRFIFEKDEELDKITIDGKNLNIDYVRGIKWKDLDKEKINRFVYEVLTEYYNHYTLSGEEV